MVGIRGYKILYEEFIESLNENSCVQVKTFYEKLKKSNDLIPWNFKMDAEKFKTFLDKKEGNLEVLAEGFRCLCQIHINLIRDFEVFKEYPIRKYSSAFNYISKISDFRVLLENLGYEDLDMKFDLKVESLTNKEETKKSALNLLISFMEVMELYKLQFPGGKISDLIAIREDNISKNKEKEDDSKLTDDDIWEKFKNCELCTDKMNDKGSCETCDASVTEFSYAWKFKDFLAKKFHVDTSGIHVPGEKFKEEIREHKPMKETAGGVAPAQKNKEWSCAACTYVNSDDNINCTCCETPR